MTWERRPLAGRTGTCPPGDRSIGKDRRATPLWNPQPATSSGKDRFSMSWQKSKLGVQSQPQKPSAWELYGGLLPTAAAAAAVTLSGERRQLLSPLLAARPETGPQSPTCSSQNSWKSHTASRAPSWQASWRLRESDKHACPCLFSPHTDVLGSKKWVTTPDKEWAISSGDP